MSPKVHEGMSIALSIITILIIVVVTVIGYAVEGDTESFILYFCGGFIGCLVLVLMFIYGVPVRCDKAGCKGQMRPGWRKEDGLQWRLFYECNTCDNVHNSNFTFRIGNWDE